MSRLLWVALVIGLQGAATPAMGQTIEREMRDELRVCADENLLPYSDRAGAGFENRLAEMIAADLDIPVTYTWWPQTIGFLRNTLYERECDVVLGITEGHGRVLNTNPYYRSVYCLVYRDDLGLDIESVADPIVRDMRLGVVEKTPPVSLLRDYGYSNLRPYQLTTDTRAHQPARRAIEDVAAGAIDGAIIWGPIAGHFAAQQDTALRVIPLLDEPSPVRLDFFMTMGVRHGELEWKHTLNDFIRRHEPEIRDLLLEYNVPLVDRRGRLVRVRP